MEFNITTVTTLLVALMGLLKVIVTLTPTEKDNKVFGIIDEIFDSFLPNYKKGGGKHPVKKEK